MPTQKWCSVAGCKEFTFSTLNDFHEIGWNAFNNKGGKAKCFCPKHIKEMREELHKVLLEEAIKIK